jgi:MFS family permease
VRRNLPLYLVVFVGFFVAFIAVPIVVANLWLVGALSRRFSTTTMTIASGALTGLFMIVVPLPGILNLLWVTLGLTALGLSVCMPSCATMISLAVGDEEQGRVMGTINRCKRGPRPCPVSPEGSWPRC